MTIQRCSNLMYTTLSRFRPHGWVWILMLLFILWPLLSMAKDSGEYLNDARSYYDKDEYNAVVIQLKNALLIEPDNAQARLLLGKAYLKLQDGLSAEKELLRAQDLDLPRELVLPPLGRAMLMNGKSEKLLQTMAIEEGDPLPLRADILVLQGRAYMTQQHYAMAEEKFTRAQDLQPENADAQVGIAQLAMQDQDIARSGELVDRAIVLDPRNEAAWILKGDLLRLAGKHSEAASAYQQALDTVPGGVRARLGKAMAYISEDKPDKALTEVGQVLDRFPNYYPAQYIKALALFQQQDLVPARDSLVSVFKQAPDHLPSHFLAGTIAYQQGQLSQAEQHLRIYWSRAPGNREATKLLAATLLKSGEPGKAIEILAPGLSSASDDAQYLALLGSAYLSHGETDRGLELLEQAAVVTPDVAGIHAQLAIGRLAQGNVDQAITRLHSAVDLGEDLIQADVLLVMAYLQSKEYDNALTAIDVLSDKMPDSPLPENLRGVTYFRMGDREAAKNAYEAALAIQPDFLPSYFNLAQLDREAGDMKKAEARYRKVLSYDEGNLKALLAMAILAAEDGRADETEKWLKQANTSHPEDFNAGLLLLKHYLQQDETQAALDLATEMQVTHPRNAAVLDLLSIAQFNAGKTKDALATIKKLAEVAPNSHEVHFQLAKVQLQQKQIDAARNSLQRAIELQHDYPEAQVALGRLDIAAKEYAAARAMAEDLKKAHPEAVYGYALEGDVHTSQREPEQAATAYAMAYDKQASAPLAQKLFHSRMKTGATESAYGILRQWLAEHPQDIATRSLLASALQDAGHNQQAIEQYLKLLAHDPENVAALNNVAWLYQETGDSKGIRYADRAHELAPERPEITDTLGWLLVQNGDVNRGLVLLQEARVKAPHIPDIHYHMAVALYKSGRTGEARKELDRLLKTGQAFPERDSAIAFRDYLVKQ